MTRRFNQDTPQMQLVSFAQALEGTLMVADHLEKDELVRRLTDYVAGLKKVIVHIDSDSTSWNPRLSRSF